MKAIKNLEGVFLMAAALTVVATYASAAVPVARASQPQVVQVASAERALPTVVVHAKRLSAAEKVQLG